MGSLPKGEYGGGGKLFKGSACPNIDGHTMRSGSSQISVQEFKTQEVGKIGDLQELQQSESRINQTIATEISKVYQSQEMSKAEIQNSFHENKQDIIRKLDELSDSIRAIQESDRRAR